MQIYSTAWSQTKSWSDYKLTSALYKSGEKNTFTFVFLSIRHLNFNTSNKYSDQHGGAPLEIPGMSV